MICHKIHTHAVSHPCAQTHVLPAYTFVQMFSHNAHTDKVCFRCASPHDFLVENWKWRKTPSLGLHYRPVSYLFYAFACVPLGQLPSCNLSCKSGKCTPPI